MLLSADALTSIISAVNEKIVLKQLLSFQVKIEFN